MFTHPVPSPNCNEFTVKEEIVAVVETKAVRVVIEDARIAPVLRERVEKDRWKPTFVDKRLS